MFKVIRKKSPSYKEFDPTGKNRLKTVAKIQVVGFHGIVPCVVINLQEKTSHQLFQTIKIETCLKKKLHWVILVNGVTITRKYGHFKVRESNSKILE